MLALSYILPIRSDGTEDMDEMQRYLRALSSLADVIVVDGSDDDVYALHAEKWGPFVRLARTDPRFDYRNGKVNNVLTGLEMAQHEAVVIADDDVRYDEGGLRRIAAMLENADVVVPLNKFEPMPWHAMWDSGRTLINLSFWHDFPGTLGVRKSILRATGGYDGDVLFENLELMRTVQAAGGKIVHAPEIVVPRRPPTSRKFWSQRVRQAYDELARPLRLALWLTILPMSAVAVITGSAWMLAAMAGIAIGLAEIGRRRAASAAFPARASLAAPLWVVERAICSWLAVFMRLRGGPRYGSGRIARAATPVRELRGRSSTPSRAGLEPGTN